jgi:methylmalonyl-CoA mutase C-terminal domain/subunit
MGSGKNQKSSERPIRILLAKPAIDGHDRGIYVLARAFRDAGMEVIYPGLLPTPEEIINIAIDEDVDVIAISLLNGSHMTIFKKVMELLKKRHAEGDIAVVGGGTIPEADRPKLEKIGVTGNYGPGTPMNEIISHIRKRAEEARANKW